MKTSTLVAATTGLLLLTAPAGAQTTSPLDRRVPVTVALVDGNRFGNDAVLLRRTSPVPGNVIVLSATAATPPQLAAAAVALASVMEREGDDPRADAMFAVPADVGAPSAEIPAATRVLQRLRQAPETSVDGLGPARTAVIYLPNASERLRLQRRGKARFGTRPATNAQ